MKLIIDSTTNETIATTTDVNFQPNSTQIMIDAPADFDASLNLRDYQFYPTTQTVAYVAGSAKPIVLPV